MTSHTYTPAALAAALRDIADRLDQVDELDPITQLHAHLAIQPSARSAGNHREALERAAVDAIGRAVLGRPGRAWAMMDAPKVHHDVRGHVAGFLVESYCPRGATAEEWQNFKDAETYDEHRGAGCEGAGVCRRHRPKECPFLDEQAPADVEQEPAR